MMEDAGEIINDENPIGFNREDSSNEDIDPESLHKNSVNGVRLPSDASDIWKCDPKSQ